MVRITDFFYNGKGKVPFSVELIPPNLGDTVTSLDPVVQVLSGFRPAFFSITYHPAKHKQLDDGRVLVRKKPGNMPSCQYIQDKYDIPTIPHVICTGFSKKDTENYLIDIHSAGIENILALRGDPSEGQEVFQPHRNGHKYASELVKQIVNMNNGKYYTNSNNHIVENPLPTNFCVGVAGYPEMHPEAESMEKDLQYLVEKVNAGADYIITQMFFDNSKYFDFVDSLRELGVDVPVVPGIKPLTSKDQLPYLSELFNFSVPSELAGRLESSESEFVEREVGIRWATEQVRELIEAEVPCVHFYSMNRGGEITPVIREMYKTKEVIW